MQFALFDSSIYISGIRTGDDAVLAQRRLLPDTLLWLSSVVLEELYAGALGRGRDSVGRLEHDFERAGRILVPNLGDWTQTGRVLASVGSKYGHEKIGRGRLTNDALIAMSAARIGARVITVNERDFRKLAEFRSFKWEVSVF
jgi:predicted nucleic acid-binding protein